MSAEPLDKPGTRRTPSQTEVPLLCPAMGFEADFRAVEAGDAEAIDLPARINQRKALIRLKPVKETIREDKARPSIRHFGDAVWWEIDADGNPLGQPHRTGNGYVNFEVQSHDAVMGVLRTQL
jgi:hypothetical protein